MSQEIPQSKIEDVQPDPMFCVGDLIGQFTITEKIDEGGFGQVFKVKDSNNKIYAMKIEYNSLEGGSAIKLESIVLTDIRARKLTHFPKLYHAAKRQRYQYIVMELLGDNLKTLRYKSATPDQVSVSTWTRIGIQCLYILKTLHDIGYVHRDIKPANFAMGCGEDDVSSRTIYLFDFGLARRFVEVAKDGKVNESAATANSDRDRRKSRKNSKTDQERFSANERKMINKKMRLKRTVSDQVVDPGVASSPRLEVNGQVFRYRTARPATDFRGTQVFASPNAHKNVELGRADDIWSLMYMLADMVYPLPWLTEPEPIENQKDTYKLQSLFKEDLFAKVDESLRSCSYYEFPDYELVYQTLKELMDRSKAKWRDPYDWEMSESPAYLAWKDKMKMAVLQWEDPKGFFKTDGWAGLSRNPPEKIKKDSKKTKKEKTVSEKRKHDKSNAERNMKKPSEENLAFSNEKNEQEKKKEAKNGGMNTAKEHRHK